MITWFLPFILFLLYENSNQMEVTPEVKIIVSYPPPDKHILSLNGTISINVQRGTNLVMECQVIDKPQNMATQTFWKLYPYYLNTGSEQTINNGMTSRDHSKFRVGQGREPDSIRLEILTVDESFGGIYACEVQYSATVLNARAERTVFVYDPPKISYTEYKTEVEQGKDVQFLCKASGLPPPTVLWKRIGGDSNIIKNSGVVRYDNSVSLNKVSDKDAGTYACYAENIWGSVERKFSLTVIHKPVVSITPNGQDASQKMGCMLQLTCVVKAYPTPGEKEVQWSSNSKGTLKTEGRFTTKLLGSSNQETFYILRIFPTTAEDLKDTYACTAANSYGQGSASVTISESTISNPMMIGPQKCPGCRATLSFSLMSVFCLAVASQQLLTV